MNKNISRQPVIVGIFIFIGVVILVLGVLLLGGQHQSFERTIALNAVFDDIEGLKAGDNIWYAGVKVGVVKYISFTKEAKVQIGMKVQEEAEKYIHKDSKARISSNGLMGNKIIIIYDGTSTSPLVADNDFLETEKIYGAKDMLNMLDSSNRNLMTISKNIKNITSRMLDGNGTISVLLNDSNLSHNLKSEITGLESTLNHFRKTAEKSGDVMDNLVQFSSQLNKPGNSVNDIVTDTVIYNNLRNSITQLRESMYAITEFVNNLEAASEQLHSNDNPAGVILNDKQAAENLKAAVKNLNAASKKLDEDLEAVQHNFLLRGYFKDKEKEEHKKSKAAKDSASKNK